MRLRMGSFFKECIASHGRAAGWCLLMIGTGLFLASWTPEKSAAESDAEQPAAKERFQPASIAEARSRARLLHDTLHPTLQYVHRDYYREEEGLKIPAASLKAVFKELAESQNVELKWLAVDARAMNVDHEAETDFDKKAVEAIHAGNELYEAAEGSDYRYAGRIVLHAECLKCHLPARSSNKPRSAALVIRMPMRSSTAK